MNPTTTVANGSAATTPINDFDGLFLDESSLSNPDANFGSIAAGSMVIDSEYPSEAMDEMQLVQNNIAELRADVARHLREFSRARVAGDGAAADRAMEGIERTKRMLTKIQEYSSMMGKMDRSDDAGLTLNRRDLPKFQLVTSAIRPFPGYEVFESVEHFLREFEDVIASSSLTIERVWKRLLPLCLPHGDKAWAESDLKKCQTWVEARQEFVRHHGSSLVTRRYTDQVFTMTMSNKESVSDYAKRFQLAMYNAGLPRDCPRVADRFLASLTRPVQTLIRVTLARAGLSGTAAEKYTVDQITQVGRDILGDDHSTYYEAVSLFPGAPREQQHERSYKRDKAKDTKQGHAMHRTAHSNNKVFKSYFCVQHGKNGTHDTKDCYTVKKRGDRPSADKKTKERECWKCHQTPWHPGHKCAEKSNTVLAVSRAPSNEKSIEEQVQEDIDMTSSELENASYDCKYLNKNKSDKFKANDAFNLCTPLIVESERLLGQVDTGSSCSFISLSSLKNKLHINKIYKLSGSYNFLSHENSAKRIGITVPLEIKYANGIKFKHSFEVMNFNQGFEFDILLGTDILPKMNIGLTGVAFRIKDDHAHSDAALSDKAIFDNLNIESEKKHEPDNSPAGTPEQRAEFMSIIKESLEINQSIPMTSSCPLPESIVHLPTKEGATAYRRQYPIPYALRPVLDKQIKEWLETGTIIRSRVNTSFNSPLLLVPKRNKDGEIVSHRACLDVRSLNQILPPTFNFPVPLVKDIFDNLAGKKVFTTLDLSNAYHRFKVAPEDVHKLSFTYNGNGFSFQKACFGVKMLTSQFQKVMATLFEGVDCVQNFVDDCIVASESIEQHARDVKFVIERLNSANLILKESKCSWFQHSVRMLGFVVDASGVRVDQSKLTNVAKWPLPNKSKKHIQQFMGLVNYLREFIPMISRVAEPLTSLVNAENVEELWTNRRTQSFNAIKEILQSKMMLHYPDLSKKFYVATDASLYGVAAVLFQKNDVGQDLYVGFVSSSLSPSQRRWSTTKRELYAVVLALLKFRKYIWGNKFTVFTDHKALVYLHTQKIANPMMTGWIETLLDFDFDVVHIPGILNKLPDILSRLYPPLEDEHKLVEDIDAPKIKRNPKNRFTIRKKRFSQDKSINVLATKLVETRDELTGYMTPPEEERDALLRESHSLGHFGSQAIVRDLHSQGLHWTNIYAEAKDIVSSCIECQKHNISKRGYHPLSNVVAHRPFDHIAIDLAGPFDVTEEGYVYMLVITDICSKFVILRPLKNKQSDTVAKELVKVYGDFGVPRICQSDNGLEFKNAVMTSISKNLGIDRRYTTPYHPRANGAAENAVRTATNTLRKMMKSDSHSWAYYLPIIQLCMNRHIKAKTMSSPFSLMFARRVNLPDDYGNEKKFKLPIESMTVKELEERVEYMDKIVFPAIIQRTEKINEEYNKKFNQKNVLVDIPVGTHVMVRLQNRSSKLAPMFEGPYTVVRRNTGGSYELKDEQNELLSRNYVPSELKVVTLDESSIEEEYYEVEDIRDHRGEEGHREYLTKWKGYSEKDNTWQKASDFTDPTIIQRYWNKQKELQRLEHGRAEQLLEHSESTRLKRKRTARNSVNTGKKASLVANGNNSSSKNKQAIPATLSREERLSNRNVYKRKRTNH
jgi:hypothetical protein